MPKSLKPSFHNIHITQIIAYRLPLAGIVSILHRISGVLLFLALPFLVWAFEGLTTSVYAQQSLHEWMQSPLSKMMVLLLTGAFLYHLVAGLRFLYMDVCHHAISKVKGRQSAVVTLCVSLALTVLLAFKIFGVY